LRRFFSKPSLAAAWMIDGSPESDTWLKQLVDRTPLLPDPSLRRHWRRVIPFLPTALRYELAAILVEVEPGGACA
jgi:hypothetical protein